MHLINNVNSRTSHLFPAKIRQNLIRSNVHRYNICVFQQIGDINKSFVIDRSVYNIIYPCKITVVHNHKESLKPTTYFYE
jgi:hypothetical protein